MLTNISVFHVKEV